MIKKTSKKEALQKEEPKKCWDYFCTQAQAQYAKECNIIAPEAINNILSGTEREITMLENAEKMTEECLKKAITPTQLRTLFNVIKNAENQKELEKVRLNLTYILARQHKESTSEFISFLKELLKNINDDPLKLERFKDFMEALISYHKDNNRKN